MTTQNYLLSYYTYIITWNKYITLRYDDKNLSYDIPYYDNKLKEHHTTALTKITYYIDTVANIVL